LKGGGGARDPLLWKTSGTNFEGTTAMRETDFKIWEMNIDRQRKRKDHGRKYLLQTQLRKKNTKELHRIFIRSLRESAGINIKRPRKSRSRQVKKKKKKATRALQRTGWTKKRSKSDTSAGTTKNKEPKKGATNARKNVFEPDGGGTEGSDPTRRSLGKKDDAGEQQGTKEGEKKGAYETSGNAVKRKELRERSDEINKTGGTRNVGVGPMSQREKEKQADATRVTD